MANGCHYGSSTKLTFYFYVSVYIWIKETCQSVTLKGLGLGAKIPFHSLGGGQQTVKF